MKQMNFKAGEFTTTLLEELEKDIYGKDSGKKSEIIRMAIQTLAMEKLGQEKVNRILLDTSW